MLRRFLQSMTGRFFLILLGGTIVSGTLAIALAAYEGRGMLNDLRNRHLTERIEQIILTLDETPAATRPKIAKIAGRGSGQLDTDAVTSCYLGDLGSGGRWCGIQRQYDLLDTLGQMTCA